MSEYSNETFANACYEKLRVVDASIEPSAIPRLATMVKPALEVVSQRVAAMRELRHLLRHVFSTFAVASGVGSLTALQSGAQPILLDAIYQTADIRTASGQKLQMLPDRASLDQERPGAFLYGAHEGLNFYTDAPDGNLTITGQYMETNVANLPSQLIPMLFSEIFSAWGAKA
jgi:hypothetical protein